MTDIRVLLPNNLRLDLENECIWRSKQAIQLTPKAFALLRYLAERPGRLVTKDELLKAVWPEVIVSEGVLTTHMGVIRQALGDNAKKPRYIETVHRRGYRWLAPLTSTIPPVQGSKFKVQSFPSSLAPNTQHLAPTLVGRETELTQLQQRWEQALRGERQLVFVTGEPGIGKTALIEVFLQSLASRVQCLESEDQKPPGVQTLDPRRQTLDTPLWLARGQCIEQHGAGEAYLPVLEALGRLCRAPEGERLITLLHHYAPTWLVQLPAVLDAEQREALQRQTLGVTKTRMLREMAEALEALTAERPVVLWLEDLHWSDVSTLDLLALLARRKEQARLLIIGSYRPVEMLGDGHPLLSLTQELHGHRLCTEVAPHLLTAVDIDAYVQARFPVSALPTDWTQMLAQHSGGNPLFLVNVVDDLVDRGVLGQVDGCWTLQDGGETNELGVPESLRQLIARQCARLLLQEQQVLEAASVAGMEFSAASVAAALAAETVDVEERCSGLASREQFLRSAGISEWPDGTVAARYSFLHALYQQLWHERVPPARQVQCHLRIGERKEAAYGVQTGEIAAELAVHFEQGSDYPRAVRYLQQAGQNAVQRSAHQEAIAHFTKGLGLLTTLPDTPERAQQELILQLALGAPLIATKGYSAPGVGQVYSRARELCQQLEGLPELFPILYGLTAFSIIRGKLETAHELSEQLLRLAHSTSDSAFLVLAHRALGTTLLFFGEFASAQEHFKQGLAVYDPRQHRSLMFVYGVDPKAVCLGFLAQTLWCLGYPDQALQRSQEVLSWAQELAHPYGLGGALFCAAWLHQHCGDAPAAQARAEAAIALSTEQGFALSLAMSRICRGWALAEQRHLEDGISEMSRGLADCRTTEIRNLMPYFLASLGEVYGKGGQIEEGLGVVAEALTLVDKTGERLWEAELYRLKGGTPASTV